MRFEELALPETLSKGIAEAGFTECTPIQEQNTSINPFWQGCGRSRPDRYRQDRRLPGHPF